ncbi:hypothetical protein M0G43_13660 [Subsaxibacter sp. CAU 1640]|uniref:hypothetical protein n=1 Tax=Subsaxibacter sp. CAU 1640 TaxID=2933271 RepID=UPI0020033A33|nr:hypothetical protein [Subsaxibacter sp. CAU 1640]MCK7591629.1 hypothetical protein [Subsaxibacter sp. CAU 1640]
MNLFGNIKSLLKKDELWGEWNSDDGSGFMMIMGSWMKINSDGTGKYESWSEGDDETGGYNYSGEFEWERIGEKNIRIRENETEKTEEIEYKLERKNGRIELTSPQPELEKFGIDAFWNFAQKMFKKE